MAFTVKIQQKRNNTVPPLVTGRQDRAEQSGQGHNFTDSKKTTFCCIAKDWNPSLEPPWSLSDLNRSDFTCNMFSGEGLVLDSYETLNTIENCE